MCVASPHRRNLDSGNLHRFCRGPKQSQVALLAIGDGGAICFQAELKIENGSTQFYLDHGADTRTEFNYDQKSGVIRVGRWRHLPTHVGTMHKNVLKNAQFPGSFRKLCFEHSLNVVGCVGS